MGYARAQVSLRNDSALPADVVMNTWHFVTPSDVASAGTAISGLLETFYLAVDAFLSARLSGGVDLSIFDLEEPSPRVPAFTDSFTITPATGDSLPNEVAVALAFQGVVVSGTAQARRRGRIFLGSLHTTAITTGVGDMQVSSGLRSAAAAALEALAADTTTPGLIWSVFSPTTAGPEPWSAGDLADAFVTVTNGWIDNSCDTVRSRGLAASQRTVWSV